jgi:hypothetical protein
VILSNFWRNSLGENDYGHSSGDNSTQYEIVGTIPSSHVDDVVENNEVVVENNEVVIESTVENNDLVIESNVENNDLVIESNVEDNKMVVVGTIPCPTNPSGEAGDKKIKFIVYKRRRFKNQGEQVEQPQSQETPSPVPNLHSDPSLSSSLTPTGNVSPNLDHLELPLAQRREPRVNARKRPPCLGFENDIVSFIGYSHVSPAYRTFIASL